MKNYSKVEILAFGIVKDIFGNSVIDVDVEEGATIDALKMILEEKYPQLNQLGSYLIAVNNEYASGDNAIYKRDEIAVIPPVSGG